MAKKKKKENKSKSQQELTGISHSHGVSPVKWITLAFILHYLTPSSTVTPTTSMSSFLFNSLGSSNSTTIICPIYLKFLPHTCPNHLNLVSLNVPKLLSPYCPSGIIRFVHKDGHFSYSLKLSLSMSNDIMLCIFRYVYFIRRLLSVFVKSDRSKGVKDKSL